MNIKTLHHIGIICSNCEKSKQFYTEILWFKIDDEIQQSDFHFEIYQIRQHFAALDYFPEKYLLHFDGSNHHT